MFRVTLLGLPFREPRSVFVPGLVSMVCRSVWSSKFQIAFTRLKRVPFRVMHHRVASSADQTTNSFSGFSTFLLFR